MSQNEIIPQEADMDDLAAYLTGVLMFSFLTQADLQLIEKYMSFTILPTGSFLFREGDRCDAVYFIIHGTVEVVKANHNDQPIMISTLSKGATIGEMALLDRLTRSASIRAAEQTALVELSQGNFELILRLHSQIGINIMRGIASILSMNLRKTSEKLTRCLGG